MVSILPLISNSNSFCFFEEGLPNFWGTIKLYQLQLLSVLSKYLSIFSLSFISITPWEFSTSSLADGLSLESEWQQVSSDLQDFAEYSSRSQQYCSLDVLHLTSHFQILLFQFQFFARQSQLLSQSLSCSTVLTVPKQGPGTYLSFRFLSVLLCGQLEWLSSLYGRFSFLCWLSLGLVVWSGLGDPFVSQNPREVCVAHFPGRILDCAYAMVKLKLLAPFPVDHLLHPVMYSLIRLLC